MRRAQRRQRHTHRLRDRHDVHVEHVREALRRHIRTQLVVHTARIQHERIQPAPATQRLVTRRLVVSALRDVTLHDRHVIRLCLR